MLVIRVAPMSGLLLMIWLSEPLLAQKGGSPKHIDVTATDFAFPDFPATIRAGPTIFSFINRGKVTHELSIARLKSGATLDDFANAKNDPARRRDLIDRSVGILIATPGNSPDGRLLADLRKGATYVVFCNLRDKPDAPGHLMFGMYTSFTPR